MEVRDMLIVGIEASITLAGFSGVLVTFQFRDRERVRRTDVVALATIVQNSLWCALACALPLVLRSFEISEPLTWRIGSAFAVVLMSALIAVTVRGLRGAVRRRSTVVFFNGLQLVSATLVVLNALNVLGIHFEHVAGPYVLSLVWGLSLAGYMFSRLLLRPLWYLVQQVDEERERAPAEERDKEASEN